MKNYLVLENGKMFNLNTLGFKHNVLGLISVDAHTLSLDDPSTGRHYQMPLEGKDAQVLSSMIMSQPHMLAKYVTDELPLDFHLYDLKTVIMS